MTFRILRNGLSSHSRSGFVRGWIRNNVKLALTLYEILLSIMTINYTTTTTRSNQLSFSHTLQKQPPPPTFRAQHTKTSILRNDASKSEQLSFPLDYLYVPHTFRSIFLPSPAAQMLYAGKITRQRNVFYSKEKGTYAQKLYSFWQGCAKLSFANFVHAPSIEPKRTYNYKFQSFAPCDKTLIRKQLPKGAPDTSTNAINGTAKWNMTQR